jgi:(R)-2-hydroxyacyl-CoA dehydratese activating ATPase
MYLGIDSGSTTTKLVLARADGVVVARRIAATGADCAATVERLWAEVAGETGVGGAAVRAVATGYGRRRVKMAGKVVTEISCHAAGVHRLLPGVRYILDVGGQDSKAIRLASDGRVEDFIMNDKCAAGTGRFLEVLAGRFGVGVGELGTAFDVAAEAVEISSTCAIFAETEVISLLSEGHSRDAVLAGAHLALARRVATLGEQLGFDGPVAFSGGVALNAALARMLERALGLPVRVCPEPQMTAALGAALLGAEEG